MKKIFICFVTLINLSVFGQDYLGLYLVPNVNIVASSGNTSNVPTAWFSDNNNQFTNQSSLGQIGVSAQISGARSLNEPATSPATNPHPEAMFGGQSNDSDKRLLAKPWFVQMSDVGTPSDSYFSPTSGISGMSVNSHYAFEHYVSTEGLLNDNAPTEGRYFVGTITYTFTKAVNNPIFHVVGLGGYFSSTFGIAPTMLFSVDFDFLPNSQAGSISMLSGTTHTSLSGNTISNSYSQAEFDSGGSTGTSGNDAGSGSFQIIGNGITSVSFNLYMVGKSPSELWSTILEDPTPKYSGDRFNTTWTLEPNSLPVKLADFRVLKNRTIASIDWKSASEEDFSHYEIERSFDGKSFVSIGNIIGLGSGSSYSKMDAEPHPGLKYYRLKMVDLDGSYVYSEVKVVDFSTERSNEFAVFPNPFHEGFTINGLVKGDQLKIYDLAGKLVFQNNNITDQILRVELDDVEPGLYNVLVISKDEVKATKLLKVE